MVRASAVSVGMPWTIVLPGARRKGTPTQVRLRPNPGAPWAAARERTGWSALVERAGWNTLAGTHWLEHTGSNTLARTHWLEHTGSNTLAKTPHARVARGFQHATRRHLRPGEAQWIKRVVLRMLLTLAEAAMTNGRQHRENLCGHDPRHK